MNKLLLAALVAMAAFFLYRQFTAKTASTGVTGSTDTAVVKVKKMCPSIIKRERQGRPVQQRNVSTDDPDSSWLDDDISRGNPISWSGKPNSVAPYRPAMNSLCYQMQRQLTRPHTCGEQSPQIVIQGHSVPLPHELHASRQEGDSITPFGRLRSSPACCPSTYSTDGGCVCGL